ncbi:hypothetical protein ACWGI8_14090 [Streptomyces sp. NPDC054841]
MMIAESTCGEGTAGVSFTPLRSVNVPEGIARTHALLPLPTREARPVDGCDVCGCLAEQRDKARAARNGLLIATSNAEIRAHAEGHAR